jgi:hypothetical protein
MRNYIWTPATIFQSYADYLNRIIYHRRINGSEISFGVFADRNQVKFYIIVDTKVIKLLTARFNSINPYPLQIDGDGSRAVWWDCDEDKLVNYFERETNEIIKMIERFAE